MNCAVFSEGVEYDFGFTNKCFGVACGDLDHVPMKGLRSKTLGIHLGFSKEI